MILKLQRWYAFSVLLLRDFIDSTSGQFVEWKTQVFLTLSETCLIVAIIFSLSAAEGHLPEALQSTSGTIASVTLISAVLFFANDYANRRLLPRFESDFSRLGRTAKIAGTIGVLLFVILSFAAVGEATLAVRGLQ